MNNEYWKNKNVLVTGATGLLGSWIVKSLTTTGAAITVLVRDWVPRCKFASDNCFELVNVIRGRLEDINLLTRAINEYEIDTVFHIGAQTIVQLANRNPLSTFEANIKGTWNVLEAART